MAANPATLYPLIPNPNPAAGSLPPQLPTWDFNELVSNMVAAWAANAGVTPQLNQGDPLLAIFQSFATQIVFLENMATQLAALTRAQTSTGANLDTWMGQFSFTRLPAVSATGEVVLSVNSAHSQPTSVPLSTIVQISGGAIQYQLVADNTQPDYASGTQTYVLPAGQLSMTATVQALVPGAAYNVQANQLTQFLSSVPGIDNVTNPNPILNGVNAETDSAFRARFVLYLLGLREATLPAIESAIEGVQSGIEYVIVPNQTINGLTQYGYFYVTIWPYTDALQSEVYDAIAAAAALGVQFNVYSATELTVSVTVSIEVETNYVPATVQAAVQGALTTYITGLTLGETLYWSYLYDIIYGISGVLNTFDLLVNGGTSDIIPGPTHIVQPQSVVVNVVSGTA